MIFSKLTSLDKLLASNRCTRNSDFITRTFCKAKRREMYELFSGNVVSFGRLNLQSMNSFDLAIRGTDIAATLRASLIFAAMLSATLFVGCQTSKSKSQAS